MKAALEAGPARAAPHGCEVAESEAHVWVVDLASPDFASLAVDQLLDPQERRRADRLRRDIDRRRFTRVHVALRQILAAYLACPPVAVAYEYGCPVCGKPHGKPTATSLADGRRVAFNMARSGDLGLVAVVGTGRVGVDVERFEEAMDDRELSEFFAAGERDALATLDDAARRHDTLVVWTRKEAYTKALGAGLTAGLDTFEVSLPPAPPRLLAPTTGDTTQWTLADVPLPEPYAGTVVAEGEIERVRFITWRA